MAGFVERRNGRHRARFPTPGGGEINETFDRKGDARDWLHDQNEAVKRGRWIDPRGAKTLFGDLAGRYLDSQLHLRESSWATYESDIRLHILPTFRSRQLRAIGHTTVQNWVTSLAAKGLAPSTIERIYGLLSMILVYAVVDERLITESPCSSRINLPVVSKKVTIPTLAQIELVHSRLPARYRRATAMGNGLRGGEMFGLTVDRVDFLRREIRVDRQLQVRPKLQALLDEHGKLPRGTGAVPLGDGLFLVEPKVQRSIRTVPIGDIGVRLLSEQVAEFPPTGVGLVFTTGTGRPVRRSVVDDAWERATRRRLVSDPELPDADECRGARDPALEPYFTFHDERHFFASGLIARGLSVKAVAAILGHSERECQETYAHLWPDDFDRARAAADDFLTTPSAESLAPGSRPGHGLGLLIAAGEHG